MSNICFADIMNFKKLKSGRLICSFILFANLFLNVGATNGQVATDTNANVDNKPSINIELKDVNGDGIADVSFENKDVKFILSSKTGAFSLYYIKGSSFEENLFPPDIIKMGYNVEANSMKAFDIDNADDKSFGKSNYTFEVESQTATGAVIIAKSEVNHSVDVNTPDNEALRLVRRYTFAAEGYRFNIENTIVNLKEKLAVVGNDNAGSFAISYGPGVFMEPFGPCQLFGLKPENDSDVFSSAEGLNKKGMVLGSFCGAGIKDQYFSVFMEMDSPIQVLATPSVINSTDEKKKPLDGSLIKCVFPKFNLGAKESRTFNCSVYAGPFVLEELQQINRTKIAEFGFLNRMMLKTLRMFYSWFPNYGVAIILLTLLVRLVLYPLTLNQTKSMAKMQKIQPRVKEIQERYKEDPQKMNEEIMKLYTKNKVNPLGGCLPLLLQLPIIMALYNTFRIAVELRKAPFLWMTDLSKGDPYLILPIAIAALMYYQQNKTTMDPQQKQAMAFMPMMMLVITFSLPSGLLVYWFASSVLGLLQQIQANRLMAKLKEEK